MDKNWTMVEKNIWKNVVIENKYKVILYCGRDASGKMKKTSKVLNGTLTDARNLLILHEANRVMKKINVVSKKTLPEVFEDWNTIGDGIQTEETTQTSNANLQRHMIEYFGEMRVDKITTTKVREYLAYLKTTEELSNNTINKHRTHLNTIYNYMLTAPEEYGIYNNPVQNVKPYKVDEVEFEIYEPEEAKQLLVSLHFAERHSLEVAVNLAFWCACRREETCALKWKYVDFEKDVICIKNTRTTAKGKVVEKERTKNRKKRYVGITPWLHMVLQNEYNYQQEMKKLLGSEYIDNGYVFCHDNGVPWHPNSLSREYKRYLQVNDFKVIRYHDLRHTNLSMLLTQMGVVEVAQIGGHQRPSTTTDIYGHTFNNTVVKGANVLAEIMDMN